MRAVWLPSREGPAAGHDGRVLVSFTDFTADRARHLPDIYREGIRLRAGWYAMPGAVGMWLWTMPLQRRTGSLTVWQSAEDLRRFVSLPAHVAIMRRYRARGRLRSSTWELERFDAQLVREHAMALLG